MKYILNEFIDDLVKELKRENDDREYYEKSKLNIPYIIAPLKQNLLKDDYKDFISNLSKYNYQINYSEDTSEGYTNGSIDIYLYQKNSEHEEWNTPSEKFHYNIQFGKDQRYWGYCECNPEDNGYREDKQCCGHGCDWTAPEFSLNKVMDVGIDSWHGNAHDYWDFEDDFYKSNKELAEEKAKKDKELKIKYLKDKIDKMQRELSDLQSA